MNDSPEMQRAALWLAVIQFFFFTTWVVYVIYLGELLDQVGIGKEMLIWFILLDQLVFAVSDTAMGYAADRVERAIGRLGPLILTVNGVSCLAFLALPFVASAKFDGHLPALLFTALIVVWIATSSVLRAPPIVLLMKHSAQPRVPRLAALSLLGLALGGAVSPYLGIYLKGLDPRLPFVITALTLFAVTIGLIWVQRLVERQPRPERQEAAPLPRPGNASIALLLVGSLLIAFGFQVHYFLNTKPQYLQFIDVSALIWVMPLFWVGFKLTAFPGSAAANRYGAIPVMAAAAVFGGLGLLGAQLAKSLEWLIGAQLLAGGAWGVIFMAGISAALGLGRSGHEGLILGLWFTALSLATVARVVTKLSELDASYAFAISALPGLCWAAGASLLVWLGWRHKRQLTLRGI